MKPVRILFVCLGNICRSPLGEGIMGHIAEREGLSDRVEVDSAGTAAYHSGERPDPRSVEIARQNGIDISSQRARQIRAEDLSAFDYIFAMDRSNLRGIQSLEESGDTAAIELLLSYGEDPSVQDVPDPYYGGPGGFDRVYSLVFDACEKFMASMREQGIV